MENQLILIDKPKNMTSFGVVARLRRVLSQQFGKKIKVGHAGTLDPFATGLLLILTGSATKQSIAFLKQDKVYEATLKLGMVSSTGDPEGEIRPYSSTSSSHADSLSSTPPPIAKITSVLQSFLGASMQTPPAFSAVKINGQRAYRLARAGKPVHLPPREIHIFSLEVESYHYPCLKIRCHVSSGTYIRTLAEDIGKKLGIGAYLVDLRRTKIGNYDLEDAKTLEDFGIK